MVERIGTSGGLAQAAIEAALKTQAQALRDAARSAAASPDAAAAQGPDFATSLVDGLRAVDEQVKRSDALAEQVVQGTIKDFHEVATLLKQSELSLKFALEVRNKFIDAYREVMRMSV
jgi:flagellar hook-basal body complex protein FliE